MRGLLLRRGWVGHAAARISRVLEAKLARPLASQKRGPKPRIEEDPMEIPGLF
jgi:hypothetical protein